MASDDMSLFLRARPGCYFRVGIAPARPGHYPHHAPEFEMNEDGLVDQRNLFLAGHSEGGIATAMYGGGEFNAYYIAGWTCRSRNPEFDRLHIPARKPVLSVVGDADPYYIARGRGHCGERFGPWVGKGSRAIVLKGRARGHR